MHQQNIEATGARGHGASFRDPAGFVFTRDGALYRQINEAARADYERLLDSGLYRQLAEAGDMVPHQDVDARLSPDGRALRVIQPERVDFISYPYEWCFSQLKDAALLTLRLQKAAMRHDMSLKDATPYNVAFSNGRPILIDTLSFEVAVPGSPWVAYRQFCEMFLAPLALMSRVDVRLQQMLRPYIDGVPLDLASSLLPWTSRLRAGLLMHIHLHATAQRRTAGRPAGPGTKRQLSRHALAGIIDSLERTVKALEWRAPGTTWGNYYEATNYTDAAFADKRKIVEAAIESLAPSSVWDLGANDGTFSRVASDRGIPTVAFDVDPVAVEKNYRRVKQASERHMLPLLLDLTHPSGRYGWANEERESLADRGPADLALALALVHHLAIAHNVPLVRVAQYLARLARALVIEFVPKEDSQVQRMLASRKDIFDGYTQRGFEEAFSTYFEIDRATPVREAARTIYVMRRKSRANLHEVPAAR
jgi:ribosomal protein L11 methylase PrmA